MHDAIRYLLLAISAISLSVTTFAAADTATPNAPCGLTLYTTVPISIAEAGFVTLPAIVNGENVRMALHTSGTFNIIGEDLAKRLKLKTTELRAGTFVLGTDRVDHYATANQLQIGTLNFGKADMLISRGRTLAGDSAQSDNVVGSLGLGMFAAIDLEIDFPGRVMRLYSTDHCPGRVVHWTRNYDVVPMMNDELGQLYFPMELDGLKLRTTLATGLPHSVLASQVAKRLLNFDESSPNILTEPSGDGNAPSYFRAMELSAEGLSIMNTRVRLRPVDKRCALVAPRNNKNAAYFEGCKNNYPLQLGMNVLSKLHIYLANKEKKLYFTADTAPLPTAPPPNPSQ